MPTVLHLDRIGGTGAVAPGSTVTLRATRSPATFLGHALPFRIVKWTADGNNLPSCGTGEYCHFSTATPGVYTVAVEAVVNGQLKTENYEVIVAPCPTGVDLVDHPFIRAAAVENWLAADPDNPDASKRLERKTFIYDSAGTYVKYLAPPTPLDTPCRSHAQGHPNPPGPLILEIHPHPFKVGDRTPANCGNKRYGTPHGGPSASDWTTQSRFSGVPNLILDKTRWYFSLPLNHQTDFTVAPDPDDPGGLIDVPKPSAVKANLTRGGRKVGACTRM